MQSIASRVRVWLGSACLLVIAGCGGGSEGDTAVSANPSTNPIASIRVTPDARQITVNQTAQFTAEALDANGVVLTGRTFTFASSSPTVAGLASATSNPTTVTGLIEGVSRITATAEGKTGTATVTVSGQADVQVSGRVIDGQTQQGIGGAKVALDTGVFATTASDGSFSIAARTFAGAISFVDLTVSRAEYVTTEFTGYVEAPAGTIAPIVLVREGPPSIISGTVRNARDNTPIANAPIFLNRGQDGGLSRRVASITANAQGQFSIPDLAAGTYTLSSVPDGFASCTRTAVSVGPPAIANQDLICSPRNGNEIRIVLTWGGSPNDLDSHLTGPNADPSRFHVYYAGRGNAAAAPFALLDVDDTSAYGPETITVTQLNSGVYRYSVHDFSNRQSAASTAMANSGAKVELYLPDGSPRVFHVPRQAGNVWTVFELSGPVTDPTVTPRNDIGYVEDSASIP